MSHHCAVGGVFGQDPRPYRLTQEATSVPRWLGRPALVSGTDCCFFAPGDAGL